MEACRSMGNAPERDNNSNPAASSMEDMRNVADMVTVRKMYLLEFGCL